jgi:hypothetical protein
MTPRGVRSLVSCLAGVLLLVLAIQMLPALTLKTPTFDEPAHIGAGLSYLKTGDFKLNLQHPPLLKEIAALPLVLGGVRWPITDAVWKQLGDGPNPFLQWQVGSQVLFANGPQRVMFLARLPFVAITLILAWVLFAWGRRMLGEGAAIGALLVCALDPTLAGHGPLVTTDTGCALFTLLFVWAFWEYLNHRSLRRFLLCGAALGAALASKFSAVFLLPIAFLLFLPATLWIPSAVPARASSLIDPFASADGGRRALWIAWSLAGMTLVAAAVVYALYFFPSNPFLYVEGLRRINADHDPSYWPYMAGHFRPRFWSYYGVAYLLKEPIPSILLAAVGGVALFRRSNATSLDRAFVLVPPAVFLIAYTLFSHNLGFRYLIPALPFLHLAGGAGFAALLGAGRWWGKGAALVLALWLVAGAGGIYPDHLSYFNEAACLLDEPSRLGADGGTRCGPAWLDDSNVDWGQGLRQVRDWLRANPPPGEVYLGYFGSLEPRRFGIDAPLVSLEDLLQRPAPGRYVLSAHLVARALGMLRARHGDGPGNWLLRSRPTAVVGHAYYVHDVR